MQIHPESPCMFVYETTRVFLHDGSAKPHNYVIHLGSVYNDRIKSG